MCILNHFNPKKSLTVLAGPDTRRLELGQQIYLHFASENWEEENGAVLMTYQSMVPAWRGENLSTTESLKSSASIRLLCHMLREPLFNDLRTKQQLGYVVSAYYDVGLAITSDAETRNAPSAMPIDYIVVNVLSQKVSPVEVANRIDEFMTGFRSRLETFPESEIRDHADALSTKLLKPIQKLGSEAATHFDKIRRYSPEIFYGNGGSDDIPWKSLTPLAARIKILERGDLLDTWDRVVFNNPSRIVSCVYGKKFPLQTSLDKGEVKSSASCSVLNNMNDILAIRNTLKGYDNSSKLPEKSKLSRLLLGLTPQRAFAGVATVALIGAGVVGAMSWTRDRKK